MDQAHGHPKDTIADVICVLTAISQVSARMARHKYGTPNDNSDYTFAKCEKGKAIAELDESLELEVMIDISVMAIPITEEPRLSVNNLEAMSSFVEFKEE